MRRLQNACFSLVMLLMREIWTAVVHRETLDEKPSKNVRAKAGGVELLTPGHLLRLDTACPVSQANGSSRRNLRLLTTSQILRIWGL